MCYNFTILREDEMTTIRRTYTKEFKIEAVRLLTERDYSIREAAESLGVSTNALRTWRK